MWFRLTQKRPWALWASLASCNLFTDDGSPQASKVALKTSNNRARELSAFDGPPDCGEAVSLSRSKFTLNSIDVYYCFAPLPPASVPRAPIHYTASIWNIHYS